MSFLFGDCGCLSEVQSKMIKPMLAVGGIFGGVVRTATEFFALLLRRRWQEGGETGSEESSRRQEALIVDRILRRNAATICVRENVAEAIRIFIAQDVSNTIQ